MAKKQQLRFNPPPGWPDAPEGWLPPDDWEPDPSWPPLPYGWQLVVDEDQEQRQQRADRWRRRSPLADPQQVTLYDARDGAYSRMNEAMRAAETLRHAEASADATVFAARQLQLLVVEQQRTNQLLEEIRDGLNR